MGSSLVVAITKEKSFTWTGGKRIGIDKLRTAGILQNANFSEFPVADELSAPLDTLQVSSRILGTFSYK